VDDRAPRWGVIVCVVWVALGALVYATGLLIRIADLA
jgi:hypothetical protein